MSDDAKKLARARERDNKTPAAQTPAAQHSPPPRKKMVELIGDLGKLQSKKFDDLRMIIEDLLPEGCTILGGKPKIGKTWTAQDMGLAVATPGGRFMGKKCENGDVLYLALEDNERRFQRRMRRFYGSADKSKWPARFTYATEWPPLGDGCIEYIEEWIAASKRPLLIVIDILENVKPINDRRNSKDPQYRIDYNAVAPFRILAAKHKLAILPLHHQRKMGSEDLMDTLSGTLGLGGGVDNAIVLGSERDGSNGRYLWGKGRDLEEFNYRVEQDANMHFVNLGDREASADAMTSGRKAILKVLKDAGQPVTISEVAARIGKSHDAAKMALTRMFDAELIARPNEGQYAVLQTSAPLEGGSGEKPRRPKNAKKPGANARKHI